MPIICMSNLECPDAYTIHQWISDITHPTQSPYTRTSHTRIFPQALLHQNNGSRAMNKHTPHNSIIINNVCIGMNIFSCSRLCKLVEPCIDNKNPDNIQSFRFAG